MILNDAVCWDVLFWRNPIIYKHGSRIVIFISFHWWDRVIPRIDERGEKIWKVIWVFFIPLISVLFGVFDEMVVPIIVWVFPTDSHELEYPPWPHVYEWCETSTPCDCGCDEMCVREAGWLLNTNSIHNITLFPSILCLRVSVVMSCCLGLIEWHFCFSWVFFVCGIWQKNLFLLTYPWIVSFGNCQTRKLTMQTLHQYKSRQKLNRSCCGCFSTRGARKGWKWWWDYAFICPKQKLGEHCSTWHY